MNIQYNDIKNFIINPKSTSQLIFDFESFDQIKSEKLNFYYIKLILNKTKK